MAYIRRVTMNDSESIWKRVLALVAAAMGLAIALYGYARFIEPRRLQKRHFRVGVPTLPGTLEGVRIAQLTDFHIGATGTQQSIIRRAIETARGWKPDIVALTGDFMHDGQWQDDGDLFSGLAAEIPTIAVLGNHDRRADAAATEEIVARLRDQGVHVLWNEHRTFNVGDQGGELVLVSVDDPSTGHDDLASAMAGLPHHREPERPVVLLAHAPEIVDQAPADRFALVLAGHTHGGQVRISPFKRRTVLEGGRFTDGVDSPYPRGIRIINGNPLFVNNGLGVSDIPLRFLAPPQVALFTLERGINEDAPADDAARFFTRLPAEAPVE